MPLWQVKSALSPVWVVYVVHLQLLGESSDLCCGLQNQLSANAPPSAADWTDQTGCKLVLRVVSLTRSPHSGTARVVNPSELNILTSESRHINPLDAQSWYAAVIWAWKTGFLDEARNKRMQYLPTNPLLNVLWWFSGWPECILY